MPIEEVFLEQTDGMTLPSKRLQREEYWYRELCSVYPYGLNDNVRGVGNVWKSDERLIVYTLLTSCYGSCPVCVSVCVCVSVRNLNLETGVSRGLNEGTSE